MALASYVAAGIAKADINEVGWTTFAYGITCYVLPFMFFFGPALMLEGSVIDIATAVLSGLAGVYFIAASMVGFVNQSLSIALSAAAFAAGLLLLLQGWQTDLAGAAIAAGLLLLGRKP